MPVIHTGLCVTMKKRAIVPRNGSLILKSFKAAESEDLNNPICHVLLPVQLYPDIRVTDV